MPAQTAYLVERYRSIRNLQHHDCKHLISIICKECLGDFISIKIYNRWGEEIFESKKGDFKWDASQLPSGVYYYQMHYQLQPFYGHIQVLK